jgi:outer membrane protein assembly factor BamB
LNTDRKSFTLLTGGTITDSAFGAIDLKDGQTLWQTAAPQNASTLIAPIVVNDLVLTGVTGNWSAGSNFVTGPGSFVALNKHTGEILLEVPLDALFYGNIVPVHKYVMFGTGYCGITPAKGTFNVWKLGEAGASPGNCSHN